jgi:hypothetical protein
MTPLMQRILESKNERRKRLMALPYPEKVRIVEQMRAASGKIRATGSIQQVIMREQPQEYDAKKP